MSKSNNDTKHEFKFSASFKDTLEVLSSSHSDSLNKLRDVMKHNIPPCAYGICNTAYKPRFITASNITSYISDLDKALSMNLLSENIGDVELFTVAYVKKCLAENGCVPFEASSVSVMPEHNNGYVNPKEVNLSELLVIYTNDVSPNAVYSRFELNRRIDEFNKDGGLFDKQMSFDKDVKNIVKSLPAILKRIESGAVRCRSTRKIMETFVAEFILFAYALNITCNNNKIGYCLPSSLYNVTTKDSEETITECYHMLKTSQLMLNAKLPFNCNMRDVVLQDVHPKFADTINALTFLMRDARSPLSQLIVKYRTKAQSDDCSCNANLVLNMFKDYINPSSNVSNTPWFTKRGFNVEDPRALHCMENNSAWLDTIAMGNNHLDTNYRTDAMGNNKVHPIMHTFDMIYKMYGGVDLKENSDIADNIVDVANTMICIIDHYSGNNSVNKSYALYKDILTLFGEIFTRNMLKLYNNNTTVVTYSDDMVDTMVPGYLYAESFIMEAEEESSTTEATETPSVTVEEKTVAKKVDAKKENSLMAMLNKFAEWLKSVFGKYASNFMNNHKKEIDWIKKNEALNKEIGDAIQNNTFNPKLNAFVPFKIPGAELLKTNVFTTIKAEGDKDGKISVSEILKKVYPEGMPVELTKLESKDDDAIQSIKTYVLYSTFTKPEAKTISITKEVWNDMVSDLLEIGDAITKIAKSQYDDMDKSLGYVKDMAREAKLDEKSSVDEKQNGAAQKEENAKTLKDTVQRISKTYYVNALTTLNKSFYAVNYKLYRDLVTAFSQQSNKGSTTTITKEDAKGEVKE